MSIPGSASPLFFQTAAGAAAAAGPIKSVRFNKSDTAYLNKTFSSAGTTGTTTFSAWVKRAELGVQQSLISVTESNKYAAIQFNDDDQLVFNPYSTSYGIATSDAKFRDPAAWLHVVVTVDVSNSTSADRLRLYVNNERLSTASYTAPTAGILTKALEHRIGLSNGTSHPLGAYLADVHLIDGQALEPTSFGAYDDSGVWQHAEYDGTYGTNGFHLFDFANESGIGNDSSGNDHDFGVNNITNVEANNTDGADNISSISQIENNGNNQTVNLSNLQTMMNTSTFQDADTDNSTFGVRVDGNNKFGLKWSNLTGLTSISVRWQRSATYDPDVRTSGTGITTSTVTVTSSRSQETFATTSTSGTILFEDVTSGSTNGFFIRAIEFKGYGSVTYPTNVENFTFPTADQDVLFDVPTNGDSSDDTGAGGEVSGNYCVLNPLTTTGGNTGTSSGTLSQGNMRLTNPASNTWSVETGTIAVQSGKWYYEFTVSGSVSNFLGGWADPEEINYNDAVGNTTRSYGYYSTGNVRNGNSNTSFGSSYTAGDVIGCAIDIDNQKIYWSKNGTWQNSANPAGGTGSIYTIQDPVANGFFYTIAVSTYDANQSVDINTGQRPFKYTAPSSFKALCTTNLPTPTVADGKAHFDTKLYTGNGTSQTVTGYGFSPDFAWFKSRNGSDYYALVDTVRGKTKVLFSNTADDEETRTEGVSSFNSDGFSLGDYAPMNKNNDSLVAWAWDAGSSTASNTDGDVTSQVRANQTAGFSVVTWTGVSQTNLEIGHGLGAEPHMIFAKKRNVGTNWVVYHKSIGNNKYMRLNATLTATDDDVWGDTTPTSSVFTVNKSDSGTGTDDTYVAFCFTSVSGYSAYGQYGGNGNTNGNGTFQYCGFRPAWILIKSDSSGEDWVIYDTARNPENVADSVLRPNRDNIEATASERNIDLLSNGFRVRGYEGSINGASKSYVWWAIAENPFQANGGLAR